MAASGEIWKGVHGCQISAYDMREIGIAKWSEFIESDKNYNVLGGDISEKQSPMVAFSHPGYRIVAGFVTSSSPVPLKTRRVGQRCMLNLSRAETSSRWCGVVVKRGGVPAQVSSTSLDHGSKLRAKPGNLKKISTLALFETITRDLRLSLSSPEDEQGQGKKDLTPCTKVAGDRF
ncbi:uncharacterized protein TNCV_1353981 [Trichonephila clavipes]|nr:uncharacterized protein TNCV_1353981 [Trichonephila clavipes]